MSVVTRYPQLDGQYTVLNPGALHATAAGIPHHPMDFVGRANSIRCPIGMEPGSAWLLIPKTVSEAIDMLALHSISWVHEGGTTTWQKYTVCRVILQGIDGDGMACDLVELRDKRHRLKMTTVDAEYNVRRCDDCASSSQGENCYFTDTINTTPSPDEPWTWQEVLQKLWEKLPSDLAGTCPTLPAPWEPMNPPIQAPENLRFHGSAWDAIRELLEKCHCKLVLDPIADTFTIVRIGEPQSGLTAAVASNEQRVLYDATPWQDLQPAHIPEKIRVFFPKRLRCGGQPQRDTAGDGGVATKPFWTIEKPTNVSGVHAGTVLPYIVDFDAEYGTEHKPDDKPENESDLENLATELVTKLIDRLDLGTERGCIVWSGVITNVTCGAEVHELTWRDYGDDAGLVTESRMNPDEVAMSHRGQDVTACRCCAGDVIFKNISGETAPAFAVMETLRGTGGSTMNGQMLIDCALIFPATKPTTAGDPTTGVFQKGRWLVNLGRDIESGKYGRGTWLEESGWALCDNDPAAVGSTLRPGHVWGPQPGSWKLYQNGCGFLILGGTLGSGDTFRVNCKQVRPDYCDSALVSTNLGPASWASGSLFAGTISAIAAGHATALVPQWDGDDFHYMSVEPAPLINVLPFRFTGAFRVARMGNAWVARNCVGRPPSVQATGIANDLTGLTSGKFDFFNGLSDVGEVARLKPGDSKTIQILMPVADVWCDIDFNVGDFLIEVPANQQAQLNCTLKSNGADVLNCSWSSPVSTSDREYSVSLGNRRLIQVAQNQEFTLEYNVTGGNMDDDSVFGAGATATGRVIILPMIGMAG